MKVIIAGGREFRDYDFLQHACDAILLREAYKDVIVISGCAPGADTLALQYARERGFKYEEHPADWTDLSHPDAIIRTSKNGGKYDLLAGKRRNTKMSEIGDVLIAFWNHRSGGTADMIDKASRRKLKVHVVDCMY